MPRPPENRILLIGDAGREVAAALAQAAPGARVTAVPGYFDAIAELSDGSRGPFGAVVASAEPIERRPEAAVRTLRDLAGDGRLILFGHPTLEPLSRKMLDCGCDDYVITPPSTADLQRALRNPPLRLARPKEGRGAFPADAAADGAAAQPGRPAPASASPSAPAAGTAPSAPPSASPMPWAPSAPPPPGLPLADLVLDALLGHPGAAPTECVKRANALLGPAMRLHYQAPDQPAPAAGEGQKLLSHPVRSGTQEAGGLHLFLEASASAAPAPGESHASAARLLEDVARLLGKVVALQDRHGRMLNLAFKDELTGAYNRRYFKHFLAAKLEEARARRFAVTLLLFDIDDFKKYNDRFGHGLGDEILRETAKLMRRCCREHDLVARIGGDEFAVVFWEKEGPRQPKEAGGESAEAARDARPPRAPQPQQTPKQIFERFRRLLSAREFPALGPTGQGVLSISGGFADFPWGARDAEELIAAADRDLMFGAKKAKKNSIFLVGDDEAVAGDPRD